MDIKKLISLVLQDDESYTNLQQDFVSLSNENQLWTYVILVSNWVMQDVRAAYADGESSKLKDKFTIKYIQKLVLSKVEYLLVTCNHTEFYLRLLATHQSIHISTEDYIVICCMCFSDINAKEESLLCSIVNLLIERYTVKVDNFSRIEQALVTYEFQLNKLHHLEDRRNGEV